MFRFLRSFSREHWIGIGSIIAGLLIGLSVPFIQSLWIDKPELSIEIDSIQRQIDEDILVDVSLHPEFNILDFSNVRRRDALEYLFSYSENGEIEKNTYSIAEIESVLGFARREMGKLPQSIKELSKSDKVLQNARTVFVEGKSITDIEDILGDLKAIEAGLSPISGKVVGAGIKPQDSTLSEKDTEWLDDIIKKNRSNLEESEQRFEQLLTNLPNAELKLDSILEELNAKRSYFRVSALLINSGRSPISVKRPSLMRVYIGSGNYVDLKMTLEAYEENATISPHGTKVAVFRSPELNSLPVEDQKLIATYWGQSVDAVIFVEDILNNIVNSNPISFSEGLNQKLIYDRLRNTASKRYDSDPNWIDAI